MSSPALSSPPAFEMSSRAASPATSSPPSELVEGQLDDQEESSSAENKDLEQRVSQLETILQKSAIYADILREQIEKHKALQPPPEHSPKSSKKRSAGNRKRERNDSDFQDEAALNAKRQKLHDGGQTSVEDDGRTILFQQPALITGAKLKNYQLEGLQWMVALHQNGISGILADEMGLGKTLQTIAFSAYLRTVMPKPFLVVCPLSVLHNWVEEYKKFAPKIPVCMYHGSPSERAELRRTVMALSSSTAARSRSNTTKAQTQRKGAGRPRKGAKKAKEIIEDPESVADDDSNRYTLKESGEFPIVVTTYEMIINDRAHLEKYDWGYIVVDEGHRLKNMDCRLMQEIKKYSSAGRMVLTGTPLHNNLAELWSLLNFVLPDIFTNIDSFQEWFNLPTMASTLGSARSTSIVTQLHSILKPFLLRRLKVDVETNLPPKKEYILYAPLSIKQRDLYDHIVDGGIRAYLMKNAGVKSSNKSDMKKHVDVDAPRQLRVNKKKKVYDVDGDDDDEYFRKLEDEKALAHSAALEEAAELGREHQRKATIKQVNNMRLQNTVMQLRKVCSHPYLFDWPLDPDTHQPALNKELVDSSGKMLVLDRLLTELFARKHKVLLFSQFTTMLDILEDWAIEFKGWTICRIDGSTGPTERRNEMNRFQTGGDAPDAPVLFLLSTRAGGLGINLTAADTVIFYEQDWNPQMDAQAQDRAHRIGQTKPVLIFRIVSASTIETKIMERATEKRKLEALVIAKGKFKAPAGSNGRSKPETMAEMAASLLKLEGEKIEVVPDTAAGKASVISDEDLDILLDRSPEVFLDRGSGWTSAAATKKTAKKGDKKAAFAVYEAPTDEGNEALAKMLGEDDT